ncbi:DNA-binding protein [Streptomyces sp. SID4985]|uniref:BRO-N domain-containing protein n=1 Tax=Streptomyces sp. SID4985 TaxID=2690292 RepID=UPI001371811E|nr:Bro-N domain-containing protein [Streptomyces sp. SID4985]MYQ45335.1 DNA-binding protein [Streptomyces sp. SID4985]
MYERDDKAAARARDAIDINDFVFAATGTRVRRLTTPEGEHWFPAVDVAVSLGYANTRQALLWHVSEADHLTLGELARSVCGVDALRNVAGRGLNKTMRMVNLRGLIALVNGCTKPECAPFKTWVSEVIATIQRDGSYSLDPAPVQPAPGGSTAYLMPDEVAEAIVRLEERNIRADEAMVVARLEEIEQARRANEERGRTNDHLGSLGSRAGGLHHVLGRIADTLDLIAERLQPPAPRTEAEAVPAPPPPPPLTPQRLLATWRARNLVVTDDVHAVAVHLAPALVRGPVPCRLEEVAERTGLTLDRVHDCVRMLIKRGCVRQAGNAGDGVPVYVLP